jgi:predicted kinase
MRLVLIRGVPGSGKTTLARDEYVKNGFAHFEADMFFETVNGYKFDKDLISEAHKWCQWSAKAALYQGRNVVVSNTFTRAWEMEPYFDMAVTFGIEPEVIICDGAFQNVHGVPDSVVAQMRERFEV